MQCAWLPPTEVELQGRTHFVARGLSVLLSKHVLFGAILDRVVERDPAGPIAPHAVLIGCAATVGVARAPERCNAVFAIEDEHVSRFEAAVAVSAGLSGSRVQRWTWDVASGLDPAFVAQYPPPA